MPGLDQPAALITLDNGFDHNKPNTFGPAGLASLDAAITEALAADPAFIAVTGKPYIFCVGADLTGMPLITEPRAGASSSAGSATGSSRGCATARSRRSRSSTARRMGGGLELALHCHYRTLSGGAAALGAARGRARPGPRLGRHAAAAEPDRHRRRAAQVIVQNPLTQNKMLKPKQAAEMGIADVLFEPADFLERSLEWAAGVVRGEVTVDAARGRPGHVGRRAGLRQAQLDERLHGAVPSANQALELLALAKDAPFADGTAAEDEALADLVMGDELRSQPLRLRPGAAAGQAAGRRAGPALARDVTKVGIVGAGLMAAQLALLFARRLEVPVVLTDLDQARVDKGVGVRARRDRQAGRPRAGWTRARRPSCAAWSAARSTRPSSPTPTS